MAKEFWLNLPVRDVARSRAFFEEMGFTFNPHAGGGDHSACLLMGEKGVILMLFEQNLFASFTKNGLPDAAQSTEVLLSISADSREEVHAITERAAAAGGTVFAEPAESQGWMYGAGFADPDGHRWNVLFMDFSKLPR